MEAFNHLGDVISLANLGAMLIGIVVGLVIGAIGTVALNWFLDTNYEVGRLPLWYLPIGVAVMWLLSELAVLVPARRASNIPPALATRSV